MSVIDPPVTPEQTRFRRRLVAASVVLVAALLAVVVWWLVPNRRPASISAVSAGATKSELVVEIAGFLRHTKVDVVELPGEIQLRVSGERRADDGQSVTRVRLRQPVAGRDVVDLNADIRFVLVGEEYVRSDCPASRVRC